MSYSYNPLGMLAPGSTACMFLPNDGKIGIIYVIKNVHVIKCINCDDIIRT